MAELQINVQKIYGAVKEATDEGKEEVQEKVKEAKNSVSPFIKHGQSKCEKLARSAKEHADNKGFHATIEAGKLMKVSDTWSYSLPYDDENQGMSSEEAAAAITFSIKNVVRESSPGLADDQFNEDDAKSAMRGYKDEVKGKVKDAKHIVSSMAVQGLSKTEEMVHSAKEFLEKRRDAKAQRKNGQVSDQAMTEEAALPGAAYSSSEDNAVADPVSITGTTGNAENQPHLLVTLRTHNSWKNCCGLLNCLTSSDE